MEKHQLQHEMMNLNYLMDHILYWIFKTILNIYIYIYIYVYKKPKEDIDNPPIRIYVNKIENRIAFKIKTRYFLELLTPETIDYLEALKMK